ncbi:unnamed protein product, partial [Rotaria sp. Silwood2]
MDTKSSCWFIIYIIGRMGVLNFLSDSTESYIPLNIIKQKYVSTKPINNFFQYESSIPTSLKTNTNINVQLLITKPNSYIYNPDDDIQLDRHKRDATQFVCKEDGYYPDPANCRIYHICTSGIDTTATCGEGTSWDPAKKICGWENTIECKKGVRKWDQITDIRGVTLFANVAAFAARVTRKSTTTRPPIKVDSNFTCEYDADGYFPDTKYCHIYHYCGIGVHTILQCADNLWFSPISEECEWPEKSKCRAAGHFFTSSIPTNIVDESETTHFSQLNIVYPPIPCPKSVQGHFPDPYDCSAFHYCNGGVDKPGFCEPGLFWDKKLGCQWPKDVPNCVHKCPQNGESLRFVAPHSCCHYYECVNGHQKEKVCPLHKLFSVETKKCEHFQVVNCGARKNCIDS